MAQFWAEQGAEGTRETVADTATLALHVLTCVGFGLSYSFHHGVRDLPDGHSMTYRDALSLCLRNIITFAIIPKKLLSLSFLPKKLRRLGVATQEFQRYMGEMLTYERNMAAKREHGTGNLMGSLVRASEEAQKSSDTNDSTRLGLTDEEIFGNIFAFNLAGHETTANTIATSLVLLAANPECQDWLIEEIHLVLENSGDSEHWNYEESFPKLKRCLAVMVWHKFQTHFLIPSHSYPTDANQYETLRLYGSVVFIPKSTGFHFQSIALGGKTHVLAPSTAVNINVQALHTNPQTWGSDALDWRPSRWLKPSSSSTNSSNENHPLPMAKETFIEPEAGTFIPWADGPRECVGRKFSQVEFVAVLASLFRDYRVRPVVKNGEGEAEARRALTRMVDDSAISAITLQMLEPRSRSLRWERQNWIHHD